MTKLKQVEIIAHSINSMPPIGMKGYIVEDKDTPVNHACVRFLATKLGYAYDDNKPESKYIRFYIPTESFVEILPKIKSKVALESDNIEYHTLDLKHFAARVEGHEVDTYNPIKRSMEIGAIKYYEGVPYTLSNKKLEYYYMVATVKAPSIDDKNLILDKIVGMVELQKSPYNDDVLWLDFISVDPEYKNRGIGKKLSSMMCEFLVEQDLKIERSRPSDEGLQYIKSVIDELIIKYNVKEMPRPKF